MRLISHLNPPSVWNFFESITQIPRASKKEEKILQFLIQFAKERNLAWKQDKAGNILIRKEGGAGYENFPIIVLQSHVDMVCEKNSEVVHNFDTDPIKVRIEDGWVKATGTTLGADNGIGMAAMLAILDSDDIPHGPLECLFTTDEETGLNGAMRLEPGFFEGKFLINLDSEDENEIFIGCAGGIGTTIKYTLQTEKYEGEFTGIKIHLKGLKGGHSGDDIEKGLGNAVKLMVKILWEARNNYDLRISSLEGGNLHNAIAREATAIVTLPAENKERFLDWLKVKEKQYKIEFKSADPNLEITCTAISVPDYVLSLTHQNNLLDALYACPHGVIAMSRKMENLVETSTNLAAIKRTGENELTITTSQRSSVESSKLEIANQISCIFKLAGMEVSHTAGYPGWDPNPSSRIVKHCEQAYLKITGKQAKLKAIHAGLECGLFLEKYPWLDMVSFGPTIKGVHSPDERIEIKSVGVFFDVLKEILRTRPDKDTPDF